MTGRPRHLDEHSRRLPVPPATAYAAARSYAAALASPPTGAGRLLTRLLGTEPPAGFAVVEEQPPRLVSLAGRHRFARYVLDLRVEPDGDGSRVTAVTWADFPGARGATYRALVVGSRGHVLAVRWALAAVARRA